MIYYLPAYEHEAETFEAAQDFLIELCEEYGELIGPTEICETTGRLENGDIADPTRVWLATCYVAVEGGPFYAPNHPDNGDDTEYDVDLTELCPECDGKGERRIFAKGTQGQLYTCTACKGSGKVK